MATANYAVSDERLMRARYASAGNVLAGLWLIAAPFVVDFQAEAVATWNHFAVGVLVALMAALRAYDPEHRAGISWTNVMLGAWMIAAPFVLGYADITAALVNSIVVGIVVLGLGITSGYETALVRRERRRRPVSR